MKSSAAWLLSILMTAFALCPESAASRARAPMPLSECLTKAQLIVLADTLSEATRPIEGGYGMIDKDMTCRVRAVIKGEDPGREIVVTIPGWDAGGPRMLDGPSLAVVRPGQTRLLLITHKPNENNFRIAAGYGDTVNLVVPAASDVDASEFEGVSPEVAVALSVASCFQVGYATLAEEAMTVVDSETDEKGVFQDEEAREVVHQRLVKAFDSARTPILKDYAAVALCYLGDPRGGADAVRLIADSDNKRLWSRAGGAVAELLDSATTTALCESAMEAVRKSGGDRHPRLIESLASNCPGAELGDILVKMMSDRYRMYSVYKILDNNRVTLTPAQTESIRMQALQSLHNSDDLGAVNLLQALRDPAAVPGLQKELDRIQNKDFGTRKSTQDLLVNAITRAIDQLSTPKTN